MLGCAVAYACHILILGRFAPKSNVGVLTVAQIATGALMGAATFWWVEPVRLRWSANVWVALGSHQPAGDRSGIFDPDLGAAL